MSLILCKVYFTYNIMNIKQFSIIRMLIFSLIGVIVLTDFLINNLSLAIFAFLIGGPFIFLPRKKYEKNILQNGWVNKRMNFLTTYVISYIIYNGNNY